MVDFKDGRGAAGREVAADLRSFGRRRSRKATDRQRRLLDELLPDVEIRPALISAASAAPFAACFGADIEEAWLEIGFGGGEHLIHQARANPQIGLIGCEPFEDGVVKVLSQIDQGGLDNVRLLADDVRPLLRQLPVATLSRVFILYPDPWPKRRHQKRRLVQPPLVRELARVMRPGAELRIVTDIGDYARTALLSVCGNPEFRWQADSPADWRVPWPDWIETRYEAKAQREGRRSYYFRFLRS